ncbi:MAG TPA: NAD(P)-dependent alcohol dehydrogenase [Solirubrobacteraceae bacterium]|nr:NAD(P)-dependent alcohol dehydrogenase [Solirubrobacteraceae bacterium]
MKAVRLLSWQAEPELCDVDVPAPGPGEVLVKVEAAGLCHSDLHVMDWPEGTLRWELPVTLGHETAGTVAALGAGALGVQEGDPVLVYGPWGCGVCRWCARGAENLCPERTACGLGSDGGLAEFVVVPSARLLVPRGDLDAAQAAPLTDAALTPYHALGPHLWRLVPGSDVVIIGVGGLGHVAVQLVRELSAARTVAIDPRESARRVATEAGAGVALDSRDLTSADVRAHIASSGAALVLDFVGSDETVSLAAALIEPGGHVSIVGSGATSFPLGIGNLPFEWSAGRPSWGTLPELHEVVALAAAGRIEIEVEQFALEDTLEGYRRLRHGEVSGRAVVVQ